MKEKFELTKTDMEAISLGDNNYINNKGANLYKEGTFSYSVDYYRLAAAMGDVHAVSNLGYCYLYGRDIEENTSLAIAYFKIAALKEDRDAAYKLGDIYSKDEWGVKDTELSVYYYRMAASFILGPRWDRERSVIWRDRLRHYPSLCYALGRELSPEGNMCTDIDQAYQFLLHAKAGYEKALANGESMYEESYQGTLEWLKKNDFDDIRDKWDKEYDKCYNGSDDDDDEDYD